MLRPFVSVLIDTFNHERFIERAVASVLEQDFPAGERDILVVDDGSTDGTADIIRKFEPRVRLLRKPNGGQASAFNTGIPECRGEIIAFLDGDDWWLPGKLSRVAGIMAKDRSIGLVGHAIRELFADGFERIIAPERSERLKLDSLDAARVFRLRKSYLGTSRMTLRTEIAQQILPVPSTLVIEADEYLFTLAAAIAEIVILKEPLTCYHIHGGNLYMAAGAGDGRLRRKQEVMAALASALREKLPAFGVPPSAVACVVEIVQAEADQMRLMLDGGGQRETLRIERIIYSVKHTDAPRSHRIFRKSVMFFAMILPPRWFYAGRRWLASRGWYRLIRKKVLPVPRITRVNSTAEFKT